MATTAAAAVAAGSLHRTPTNVRGLFLRPARWPEEAPLLTEINNACRRAGGQFNVLTAEDLRNHYEHLVHCDLATDLRVVELDGEPVGYARVEWDDERRGDRVLVQAIFLSGTVSPAAYEAALDWTEARCAAVATTLPSDRPLVLAAFFAGERPDGRAALERRGYHAARFFFVMVRPNLDEIPDFELPAGVEVRPVRPEHLRPIWEAEVAAFAGHWGASDIDATEERWDEFRSERTNDLSLWQVAWAGGQIVGMVRPYINEADHAAFGAPVGWCENISTHAEWRGRGIARALISRALVALRDRGMAASALSVDAANETGAVQLYRTMGFLERQRETDWRKPFAGVAGADGAAAEPPEAVP